MGAFDDIKSDGMRTLALIGGILAFVALFYVWSTGGTWLVIVLLVVVAGAFLFYKAYQSGYINL